MKRSIKLITGLTLLAAGACITPVLAAQITAKAVLMPTKDSSTRGWVKFSSAAGRLRVWGEISGLTPGKHGFHVHQFGDCSAPDATSAGDHFSLSGQKHASPAMSHHHSGDLGNLDANASGVAKFDYTIPMSLGVNGVLGRGLIVHAKADDLKTQPSGASGPRLACGVIGVSKN